MIGPGSYNTELKSIKSTSPSLSISRAPRTIQKEMYSPGVGYYYPRDFFKKNPSAIVPTHRSRKDIVEITPGPADYIN